MRSSSCSAWISAVSGTLIASLASLISFKLYGASAGAKKGRYFAEFSAYNFAMLIVLFAAQTGFNALSA